MPRRTTSPSKQELQDNIEDALARIDDLRDELDEMEDALTGGGEEEEEEAGDEDSD